jgi:hypothetical protein
MPLLILLQAGGCVPACFVCLSCCVKHWDVTAAVAVASKGQSYILLRQHCLAVDGVNAAAKLRQRALQTKAVAIIGLRGGLNYHLVLATKFTRA